MKDDWKRSFTCRWRAAPWEVDAAFRIVRRRRRRRKRQWRRRGTKKKKKAKDKRANRRKIRTNRKAKGSFCLNESTPFETRVFLDVFYLRKRAKKVFLFSSSSFVNAWTKMADTSNGFSFFFSFSFSFSLSIPFISLLLRNLLVIEVDVHKNPSVDSPVKARLEKGSARNSNSFVFIFCF